MAQTPSVDQAWIAAEFVKGIDAERSQAGHAKARADSRPDPALRARPPCSYGRV
jgi:hypothetical protein